MTYACGTFDQVADVEQHEVLLADAGLEVLLDLRRRQRAVVDRDQAQHALPLAVGRGLVAEHQREGVVPVGERAAALRRRRRRCTRRSRRCGGLRPGCRS